MSKPAARVGDLTAHGGAVAGPGCPNVLIGGQPAARLADMHACPLANGPVPHVGGPVSLGSTGVFIGGMPAARVGDMVTCTGPPDTIAPPGCPTVLIGEISPAAVVAPGVVGGAAGMSGIAAAAYTAALSSVTEEPGSEETGDHWIEFRFVDSAKNPVSGVSYEFAGVDGKVERGCLWTYGIIRRTGLPEAGTCSVVLLSVHGAKWSKSEAQVGDVVKLSAEVEGYEDGTRAVLEIWERDLNGADQCLDTLEARVSGKKVEAEWTYRFREDSDDYIAEEDEKPGYSDPEYYFIVTVGNDRARSAHLRYQDWIEVELKDEDDNVMSDEEFIVFISNGEIRKGKLDKNGYKKIEKLPPRPWQIIFPNINPGN